MNLRDQVCSLELSKRLNELNINPVSLYSYGDFGGSNLGENIVILNSANISDHNNLGGAYTASELIDMLPRIITINENEPFNSFRLNMEKSLTIENDKIFSIYLLNYYCDTVETNGKNAWFFQHLFPHNIWDKTLSNAAAKTLIHIAENNYKYDTKDM